jgi:hypothetical protein
VRFGIAHVVKKPLADCASALCDIVDTWRKWQCDWPFLLYKNASERGSKQVTLSRGSEAAWVGDFLMRINIASGIMDARR